MFATLKTKKTLAVMMVLVLAMTMLYGCSGSSTKKDQAQASMQAQSSAPAGTVQPKAATNDPIDISMYLMDSAAKPDQFVITKMIKDKFNINVKWMINPYDGFFDKLNVMIASNELPDLIAPIPIDQAKDIGAKGALVPLNKYIDKMPNLKKLLDADKISYASSVAGDGNVYAAPAFDKKVNFRYVPTIRADLLAETGMKQPETYDDLYNVLKAIKAKHPDSLGIVNQEKGDALNDFGTNFNTRTEMFYDETKDKFVYGPQNDGYKEMITYMNKLWNEKLLDPEFFTASSKQWEEKVLSGKAAFWLSWPEYAFKYEKSYMDLHPGVKFDTVPLMPMTTNSYNKKVVQGMPQTNTWTTMAISAKSKYIDRLIPFVDWMYSDEGSTVLQFGAENETYKVVDSKKKFTDNIKADYNDKGTTEQSDLGIGASGNLLMRVIRDDEFTFIPDYRKDVEAALDQYRKNNYYALFNKGMSITFSQDQLDEKAPIETDLKTFVSESSIKFITGQKPLSEYGGFLTELKKRGSDKLETIYGDAYGKFKDTMSKIK